jgi:kumamolisin
MAKIAKRHAVAGSERAPMPGSRMVGPANPHERMSVTILLRRRPNSPDVKSFIHTQSARTLNEREYLTHDEFQKVHSASDEDIEQLEQFAAGHGLDVIEVHPDQRRIVLSGTVAAFSTAFGVHLAKYEHPKGHFRGRVGEVLVPEDIAPIVEGVFGLDNRPQAAPHFRLQQPQPAGAIVAHAVTRSFTPLQIAKLYNFPTGVTGHGQSIAIIELGGGFAAHDLTRYFKSLGIAKPTVKSVSVDGAHNSPTGNANGPDGEVMLDIEVAGAVAPGAKVVVYFAPNTDAGFLGAIKTAIHDKRNKPSVISISWGAAESGWTEQAMSAMDQAFQDAATLGVTVCCASGDDGSNDGETDGLSHVDFPASSPFALACGGTHLESSGTKIGSEEVWNDANGGGATGGGVSDMFDPPVWQGKADVPPSANHGARRGRGVPDVSGDADPATGYQVLVDGQSFVIGGTSAVAPLWAGLVALINEKRGKPVGYLNPLVYGLPKNAGAFHDIFKGKNGAYDAHPGWDACTGLGSPDGARLMQSLN